jgi:hypothetical protein
VALAARGRAAVGKLRATWRGRLEQPSPPVTPPGQPRRAPAAKRSRPTRSEFAALPGDRLLERPVFILSSVRSGSTLLRAMLNTHSAIHAPHELHLGSLEVVLRDRHVTHAMRVLGMDGAALEYLLWDRLLHRELTRHGKRVLVNKTPSDVFRWRRIVECWPDARFIYLLRQPGATAKSWTRAHPDWPRERIEKDLLRYMLAVEAVRSERPGLTVRYEELTVDPERETKRICEYLELEWEPSMVEYGQHGQHGEFVREIGDWSEQIRSGKVQPVTQLPTAAETPPALLDISVKWGYLDEDAVPASLLDPPS